MSFPDLSSNTDVKGDIRAAINNPPGGNTTIVLRKTEGNYYLYNIYVIHPDYDGTAPLNAKLENKDNLVIDTTLARVDIYSDSSHQNMISTVYDLLRDTASNPLNPGTLQSIVPSDTLKARLLITATLDLSVPHNSPASNSNEAAQVIFTNYIQCMDNIVRNRSTIRSGSIGLPRLRTIHSNILLTNRDSVIIDPVYVRCHGTLAEYGQEEGQQKRKYYAFYEGYLRLDVHMEVPFLGSPAILATGAGVMFRISENIELYEANLADTCSNMFDSAFITGGTKSRRIIIPANDSLLQKFGTDVGQFEKNIYSLKKMQQEKYCFMLMLLGVDMK